ncbi:MAG: serine hydrolase domain-containing protein [Chloroflexota bacterium]
MAMPSLAAAFAVLARCVDAGLVPGAVAAVGTADETLYRSYYGAAELTPQRRAMREDALFDVASLTKVVVTTTLALRAVERGELFLGQHVATVLPRFTASGKGSVTIRHLLTHTSGLRAGLAAGPLTSEQLDVREAVFDAIERQPLARPPGSAVLYSDVGYITLGAVLEAVGGARLDELARREVFEPLGMADSQFNPPDTLRERVVATEVVPDRGGTVCGAVHDGTAALMGGVSGHAGLFSTCQDLERYCRLWLRLGELDGRRVLSPGSVRAATRNQTGLPWSRGFGWVLQPNPLWPSADLCSPAAYGHTGFTGTSMVVDPELGSFAILLTNRVHPTREDTLEKIVSVRACFHNAVWAALSSQLAG